MRIARITMETRNAAQEAREGRMCLSQPKAVYVSILQPSVFNLRQDMLMIIIRGLALEEGPIGVQ
jgi:hypothetical protein